MHDKQVELMGANNRDPPPIVVKANELIQNSRFEMTALQQRLVLLIISKIRREDKEFNYCEISVKEFCDITQIDGRSGENYARIKKAIKSIADKSVWIQTKRGEETLVRWIEKPYIDYNSGVIRIRLDQDMKPYLLQLKKNFTRYELYWIMNLRSKYSIRLYELLKSHYYIHNESFSWTFPISELKERLNAQNYKVFKDFKRRCLAPAVDEINRSTDLDVIFYTEKVGRSIEGITFFFQKDSSL